MNGVKELREEELKEKILKDVKKNGVKFLALRFVDILGKAKTCEIPVNRMEDALNYGFWFDGSSIEGFVRIHESDMFLRPDIKTYAIVPWTDNKVARMICDVYIDDKHPFEGDPRYNLKRVLKEAEKMGFKYKVGPEIEFFMFKESDSTIPQTHDFAGYFDLAPMDLAVEIKREVAPALESVGINIEMSHHEVAPGQHEIDFRYDDAIAIADDVLTYKNILKRVAQKYGLFASFMPKPIYGINGSGMHVHQSLWKAGKNAFFDENDEYRLSTIAKGFIAGQLHHAKALAGVVAPTVNSYKRLVPGYEAPVYICWARINRSALIRIPRYVKGKEDATRGELRCPDPSCNPYLAFVAMLQAGLDGIKNKTPLPEPVEEDVYEFDDRKLAEFYIKTLPSSLEEATIELEKSNVMKKALGPHIHEKLIKVQKEDWNEYKIQVTKWELDRYCRIL
ncbi:MAG: glutamine synthetase family protein [Candidatus Hydrothermarchaeales archaeon]